MENKNIKKYFKLTRENKQELIKCKQENIDCSRTNLWSRTFSPTVFRPKGRSKKLCKGVSNWILTYVSQICCSTMKGE